MKCVLALLALCAAAYAAPAAEPGVILGAGYVPAVVPALSGLPAGTRGLVTLPDGNVVPKEEPANIIARNNHLIAKANAYALRAPLGLLW